MTPRNAAILARAALQFGDPDQDVLELFFGGKQDRALHLLMSRYWDRVYKYCRRELRNRSLAEDVRQLVFFDAYRNLPSFAAWAPLATWLFRIARHRTLDAAKKRQKERARFSPENVAAVPAPDMTPEARIDQARMHYALVECVKATKTPVQLTVLLRFQQRLSFEEMAEILHERPNTLRVRLRRALPALRRGVEVRTGGSF